MPPTLPFTTKKPSPDNATSVGSPVLTSDPSEKICCADVICTPPPTAPSVPAAAPSTVSNSSRDSLKPTVLEFDRLLPMTPSALLSASSPETPAYMAEKIDIWFSVAW